MPKLTKQKLKDEGDAAYPAKERRHLKDARKKSKGEKHKLSTREYWRMRWNKAKTDKEKIDVWMEYNRVRGKSFKREKYANGNAVFNGGFSPINTLARKGMMR